MKLADALRGVSRLFLDSAPVIYYVERNPNYIALARAVFQRIDSGVLPAVTSPVTLAECLVLPVRQGALVLQQDFVDLIVSGRNTRFVPIDDLCGRRAAELRARYNLSLTDALQFAVALETGCDAFLTNDLDLRRVTELRVLALDDLEL